MGYWNSKQIKNFFKTNEILLFCLKIFNFLYKIKKIYRKLLLFSIDSILIIVSINIVKYFSYPFNREYVEILPNNWLLLTLILVVFIVYNFTGQYLSLSRYIKSSEIYGIALRNFLVVIIFLLVKSVLDFKIFAIRRQFILLWLISTFIITFYRFTLKEINLYLTLYKSQKIIKVAIYGAGSAGAQLASSIVLSGKSKIVAFFDDSQNLWGRKLLGIPIYPSEEICKYRNQIDQILLAIPSISKDASSKIFNKIQNYEIPVLKVPSIEELTSGLAKIDSLRPIEIEDLLGRGAVMPFKELVEESTKGLNICITGAGGSIGRELCRQVLNNSPSKLVMIDNSESNLYHLEQEIINNISQNNISDNKFILGNIKNYNFIKDIFIKNKIDVVFHAAAYKHVPLIESNPLQGIENNVFSTYSLCQAALDTGIKKMTLISTDKAVRPSNVMGASKRLAELIFQGYAANSKYEKYTNNLGRKFNYPKFSIVRFGNVLNSSGSVVPLFKKQIANGGPITLTHKNVIRYFMTVPEAAQLVIQATSLSRGGEVFLLDMGSPVRIYDLAKQMIKLSGLKIKDSSNKEGDIEIITTGLRPGEKLYEELLIEAESKATDHPLIFKAKEAYIPIEELIKDLADLEQCINKQNKEESFQILSKLVPEWDIDNNKC
tara:strand:+ start:32447 stop:34429 length:1983 start_codon:yes stop_codon:yes gene_type:complete